MFTSRKTQQKKILGVLGLLATVLILYKYRDKIKKNCFRRQQQQQQHRQQPLLSV